jgi:hypothetical protein
MLINRVGKDSIIHSNMRDKGEFRVGKTVNTPPVVNSSGSIDITRVKTVSTSNVSIASSIGLDYNGYILNEGDLYLRTAQTNSNENGIFIVESSSDKRASYNPFDLDTVIVERGDYINTSWRHTEDSGSYTITQILPKYAIIDKTININTAQIATLATTPVELIPAQGANTIIDVISVVGEYKYNSLAYTAGGNLYAGYYSTLNKFIETDGIIIASTNDEYFKFIPDTSGFKNTLSANTSVDFWTNSSYLSGDGEINIYITFRIIEV